MSHNHCESEFLSIDRTEAARLMREARAARETGDSDGAIDWAFAALPERRHARRLKIESLLRDRDLEAADALVAQGLLLRPADPALMLLHARSLLIQRELAGADREITMVLEQRASHVSSLVVGAEIARARRDFPRAVRLLEDALQLRPGHNGLLARLAEVLLDSDCIDRADAVVAQIAHASPRLQARVLRAQGRRLDAVELLEAARLAGGSDDPGDQVDPDSQDGALTADLIDGLESIGAIDRLNGLLDTIDESTPATLIRAGSAWLALGAYEHAINRLAPLRDHGPCRHEALSVTVVANSMLGRVADAESTLAQLQQTPAGADPEYMAELWRRALTAHLFLDQARTGRAEATRGQRMIEPLLRAALDVFDAEPASRTPGRRAEIQRHRSLCLAVLGRDRDAAAAIGAPGSDEPVSAAPPLQAAA